MIKRSAIMVLLFMVIAASLVAGGNNEKTLLVPKQAEIVMGVDLNRILESKLAMDSMDNMARMIPGEDYESYDVLREEVKEKIGLTLEDIDMMYVYLPELNIGGPEPEVGVSVKIMNLDRDLVVGKIMENADAESVKYKKYEYFRSDDAQAFAVLDTLFLFGSTTRIMEEMLDVLAGAPDVTKNPQLGPLMKEYSSSMFFALGVLPPDLNQGLQSALPGVELTTFGMEVNLTNMINAHMAMGTSTEDGASNFATSLQLGLGMAGQMMPVDDPSISELIMKILDPIEVNAQGNKVVIDITYSEEVIKEIQAMMPLFAGLMGGGF